MSKMWLFTSCGYSQEFLEAIHGSASSGGCKPWLTTIQVNGHSVEFKIDNSSTRANIQDIEREKSSIFTENFERPG